MYDPDATLGIVWADANAMWPGAVGALEEMVPVVPYFNEVSVAVEYVDAILPGTATPTEHVP